MSYYKEHAREYIESTMDSDMSEEYALFEPSLPKGGSILDVGFGSGRDMLYFTKQGYRVLGIDQEPQFVEHALSMGLDAVQADVLDYSTEEKFDGVWANASLVHFDKETIKKVVRKLMGFLSPKGVLLVSLKKGEKSIVDEKGRMMHYVNEELFRELGFQSVSLQKDSTRPDLIWIVGIYHKG